MDNGDPEGWAGELWELSMMGWWVMGTQTDRLVGCGDSEGRDGELWDLSM